MNKKGFTLVEVLGVCVIMGILSTIVIVSVSKVIKNSHKEYNEKQAKMFTVAAQTYFTDQKYRLPKDIFQQETKTLEEIKNEGYIKEIVDHRQRKYKENQSIAVVKKLSSNNYRYSSMLIDQDGKKYYDGDISGNHSTGTNNQIKIEYEKQEKITSDSSDPTLKEDNKYYINKSITIPVNILYSGNIVAYKYRLYKVDEKNEKKKFYESNYIGINEEGVKELKDKITLSQKNLPDGEYSLEVVGLDKEGKDKKKEYEKHIVIDGTKPKCTITLSGEKGNIINEAGGIVKQWYKRGEEGDDGKVKLSMSIKEKHLNKSNLGINEYNIDENNFKAISNNFSNNIKIIKYQEDNTKTTGQKWYGDAIDKAGNIGKCEVVVYHDKELPQCKVSKDVDTIPSGWTREDYIATRKCEDNYSGCDDKSKEDWFNNYSASNGTVNNNNIDLPNGGKVGDYAGNETSCGNHTVQIDKESPSCTPNINGTPGKNNWYIKDDVTIVGECNDDNLKGSSGCKKNTEKQIITTDFQGNVSLGQVEDNVGNTTECEQSYIQLEKGTPTINSSRSFIPIGNTTYCDQWTKGVYKVETLFTNSFSGYGKIQRIDNGTHDVNTTPSEENNCELKEGNPNSQGSYISNDFSQETNRKVCYQVVSKAGNISKECIKVQIKIDKTEPTLTLTPLNANLPTDYCKKSAKSNPTCVADYGGNHGVRLSASDTGGSGLYEWGAVAKYHTPKTGYGLCNLDNYTFPWSGQPLCYDTVKNTPMGTGKATRCYKVVDCAGNESAKHCSCQDGTVRNGQC